jgi:hypothetical protein
MAIQLDLPLVDNGSRIYLDTNALRYLGTAFARRPLVEEIRKRIVVSPLSVLEAVSQLSVMDQAQLRSQMRALFNFLWNPGLYILPSPTRVLELVAGATPSPDNLYGYVSKALTAILQLDSNIQTIEQNASILKDFLDQVSYGVATKLQGLIAQYRQKPLSDAEKNNRRVDLSIPLALALPARAGCQEDLVLGEMMTTLFSAYREFEERRMFAAILSDSYNPQSRRNRNDGIDGEQLLYLCDERLIFLTCERRFETRILDSEQKNRIIVARAEELRRYTKATRLLREILFQNRNSSAFHRAQHS